MTLDGVVHGPVAVELGRRHGALLKKRFARARSGAHSGRYPLYRTIDSKGHGDIGESRKPGGVLPR